MTLAPFGGKGRILKLVKMAVYVVGAIPVVLH